MKTENYMLPAHWASYLINGDASSFSLDEDKGEKELAVIDKIIADIGAGDPIRCSRTAFLTCYHDASPYGILPCDCLQYTFIRY